MICHRGGTAPGCVGELAGLEPEHGFLPEHTGDQHCDLGAGGGGRREVTQSAVKIDQQNDTTVETAAGLCPAWILTRCQGNSEGRGNCFPKMVLKELGINAKK